MLQLLLLFLHVILLFRLARINWRRRIKKKEVPMSRHESEIFYHCNHSHDHYRHHHPCNHPYERSHCKNVRMMIVTKIACVAVLLHSHELVQLKLLATFPLSD